MRQIKLTLCVLAATAVSFGMGCGGAHDEASSGVNRKSLAGSVRRNGGATRPLT
jgi:hypothetical protein